MVQVVPTPRLAGSVQAMVLPTEPVQSPARSALGVPTVSAAGTTSSRATLSASDGPALLTVTA